MKNLLVIMISLFVIGSAFGQAAITNSHGLEFHSLSLGDSNIYKTGDTAASLGTFYFKNTSTNDVDLKFVKFINDGTISLENLENISLLSNGTLISSGDTSNMGMLHLGEGELLTFDADTLITSGDSILFAIFADVINANLIPQKIRLALKGIESTCLMYGGISLEEMHVYQLTPEADLGDNFIRTISETVRIYRSDSIADSTVYIDLSASSSYHYNYRTFIKFVVENNDSNTISIDSISIKAIASGNCFNLQTSNADGRLYVNGIQQGSSHNFDSNNVSSMYSMGLIIPAGSQREFIFEAEFSSSAPGTVKFIIDSIAATISGGYPVIVMKDSLTSLDASNPIEGALFQVVEYIQKPLIIRRSDNFTDSTVFVAGLDDVTVLEYMLKNSDTADVNVTGIIVKAFGTGNCNNLANFTGAFFVDGTQYGSSKNFSNSSNGANFDDLSVVILGGDSIGFQLVINTNETSAPGTIKFQIDSILASNVELDFSVPTVHANDSSVMNGSNPIIGALFQLVESGTLSYRINTVFPGGNIYENTTDNDVMKIWFKAKDDAVEVKDFYFNNLLDPQVSSRGSWKLYNEADQLVKTQPMQQNIVHFELPNQDRISVPKDDSTFVIIRFDAFDITSASQSGHQFQLPLVTVEAITAATGSDLDTGDISGTAVSEVFTVLQDTSTTSAIPAANNAATGKDITIFPNPTNDYINFASSDVIIEKVSIYNQTGALVFSQMGKEKINVSHFSSGIYFLQAQTCSGEIISKKIVKQ